MGPPLWKVVVLSWAVMRPSLLLNGAQSNLLSGQPRSREYTNKPKLSSRQGKHLGTLERPDKCELLVELCSWTQ